MRGMNKIEFKEGSVFYANGFSWFADMDYSDEVINIRDFQLNEIVTGDFIPASELDTEQKYNDVVEVFGLFGFKIAPASMRDYKDIADYDCLAVCHNEVYVTDLTVKWCKREIHFNQIIAIGKLKRMMLEREDSEPALIDGNSVHEKLSNIGNVLHSLSCLENDEDLQGELYNYASYLWDLSKSMVNEKSTHETTVDLTAAFTKASSNKYEREITDRQGNSATVDVYDVIIAYGVTCPATQHAIKKLLCTGDRGHKDTLTDLSEARDAITRAIELN